MNPPASLMLDYVLHDLEKHHRDAMLDLILAWAALDGAIHMLLGRSMGIQMVEAAKRLQRVPASERLAEIHRLLKLVPAAANAAEIVKKHNKAYEKHSSTRDSIAHSKCVGIRKSDEDCVIFLKVANFGDWPAVDAVPVHDMQSATLWCNEMEKVALRLVDQIEPR